MQPLSRWIFRLRPFKPAPEFSTFPAVCVFCFAMSSFSMPWKLDLALSPSKSSLLWDLDSLPPLDSYMTRPMTFSCYSSLFPFKRRPRRKPLRQQLLDSDIFSIATLLFILSPLSGARGLNAGFDAYVDHSIPAVFFSP